MALKFWTYIETDKYNIGLSSRTVCIFDKQDKEIARFKDLDYAYNGVVSPNQELLVIKSTGGRMAVYSLLKLELITKFRFSKIDASQDDNFIFSPDGKYLYNIERHISSCNTALSIYNVDDFSLNKRLFENDDNLKLSTIEYDTKSDTYFILGFLRGSGQDSPRHFIAKLINDELKEMKFIDDNQYGFTHLAKIIESTGFTEEAFKWLFPFNSTSLDKVKSTTLSLADRWNKL